MNFARQHIEVDAVERNRRAEMLGDAVARWRAGVVMHRMQR